MGKTREFTGHPGYVCAGAKVGIFRGRHDDRPGDYDGSYRAPYEQYMVTQVLKPRGMTSSTFQQPPTAIAPKLLSSGYYAIGEQVPGNYLIYLEQAAAG